MNFFNIEKNKIHKKPEQLQRQKKAMYLKMDSVDYEAKQGTITGTEKYTVTLENCTCFDFARRQKPCKHMYALAVELGIFEFDKNLIDNLDEDLIKKHKKNYIQLYPVNYFYSLETPPPKDFVVIDFETANSQPHSICQMGIAVVENNLIVEKKDFLIRPPTDNFNEHNIDIHGITFDDVKNKPKFPEIWSQVQSYIQGKIISAYNISFDIGCLYAVLDKYKIPKPDFMVFDILDNVRYCAENINSSFNFIENCRLVTVAEFLNFQHNAHDALSDSEVAAKVQIYISENFPNVSVELIFSSWKSILDAIATRKITLADIIQFSNDLAQFGEIFDYEKLKDLLKLLEQVAAQNKSGFLYRNCGMIYEKLGNLPRALSLYKTAFALDETLRIKTKIQRLEREQRKNNR